MTDRSDLPPGGARRRRHRHPEDTRGRGRRLLLIVLPTLLLLLAIGAAVFSYGVERAGVSPRRVASYFAQHVHGSGAVAGTLRQWTAVALQRQDRGSAPRPVTQNLRIGAQPEGVGAGDASGPGAGRIVRVADTAAVLGAIGSAAAGDVIMLAPGRYRFGGAYVGAGHAGTAAQPITVRAEQPGTAILEFAMTEGFLVTAPYWRFENLTIRGTCGNHADCEHAFHVVGKATHFVARNNTITDFNAHFKINGANGTYPDDGLIEANSLSDTAVRNTTNPVITIDLVGASRWMVRRNLITDFVKAEGSPSYGAYFKGAGADNVFENNIVYCEARLHDPRAQEVGLSLGGGGTGKPYCRDRKCITEQDGGVIRGNLIAACADDGIYLNRAARSRILHNTLIDTGGISVRFASSSADVEGNLVDGAIRARDAAILRETDNRETALGSLFLGLHPVRKLVGGQGERPFGTAIPYRSELPATGAVPDLCGTVHAGKAPYGAFANFSDCLRPAQSAVPPRAGLLSLR